jgi:hypothetical protein
MSPAFLEAFCGESGQTHGGGEYREATTHIHGVAAGRDFAGVALGQSPEEGVGKGVLAEVGEHILVDLEGGEVG